MDQFENNWWSALANTNKLRLLCLGSASSAPAASPSSLPVPLLVDQVDHRDCEDYGIDPDRPDSPLSGDGIDLALAGLMKGL